MISAPDRLLRRLEWQVLRRLDGQLQGGYRTAFRGTGIDFADLRAYTLEDDVRHIDWNVTARLDEPYVRQYTEDRDITVWLVLDQSASMSFGAAEHPKDSVLTDLAVCLARLFTQGGNRVGAILYDNQRQAVIPPRTGRAHVLRLSHAIIQPAPARPDGTVTNIAAMLRLAASVARRRSLVFVISDFIGEGNAREGLTGGGGSRRDDGGLPWERALTQLCHRHEVVPIEVVDPAELDLPDLGLVLIEDAETGEQLLADTSDPLFQQRLRAEVRARDVAVTSAMRRCGVASHRLSTDSDLTEWMVELVRASKRGQR